jgi:DNA-binding CsgD family transcriptional regulator
MHQIYVSSIPDFNQMYTASEELISGKAAIDAAGYFSLEIPAKTEPALYRLHIIKKGDPVPTLVIGSKDQNYVFFIARSQDNVYLKHLNKDAPLSQGDIQNTIANKELNNLFNTLTHNNNQGMPAGRQRIKEGLIALADSSSCQLVSLLAISYTFGLNEKQKEKISVIVGRLNHQNPYGANIFQQYPLPHANYAPVIVAGVLIIAAGIVMIIHVYRKRKVLKIFRALSQREATIIKCIADGKSNKEIAAELNVELSTVKTHVNNIYTKLNVKGRKDILEYKTLFKKYGL